MGRALITLRNKADRERASKWIADAPAGTRLEFKASKRSLPQNARMWAMLTDVATQVKWHGISLTPDDWKLVFLDGLKRESISYEWCRQVWWSVGGCGAYSSS